MHSTHDRQDMPSGAGYHRVLAILLWIAVSTGLAVSIFTLIEELCLATACRDTASFTFFGFNMGWLGIAYFILALILLWLRKSVYRLDWAFSAMVFAGIGAEFRLLWIQKYVIGSWCPLCVTICCALFIAAMILLIEKIQGAGSMQDRRKNLVVWVAFVVTMIVTGLAIAVVGVQTLA
ncbi:MAG: vitamin K epoxide reductase family protein [Desulfuromonadales bacterium]